MTEKAPTGVRRDLFSASLRKDVSRCHTITSTTMSTTTSMITNMTTDTSINMTTITTMSTTTGMIMNTDTITDTITIMTMEPKKRTTTASMSWCIITRPILMKRMWQAIRTNVPARNAILMRNIAIIAEKVWLTASAACRTRKMSSAFTN